MSRLSRFTEFAADHLPPVAFAVGCIVGAIAAYGLTMIAVGIWR